MDADTLEVIYYQMIELENRLDKKIEYIKKCENNLKEIVAKVERLRKEEIK